MLLLYAQPLDISADGFYFATVSEYTTRISSARSLHGLLVEEFELQFVDGRIIDALLFKEIKPHQGNITAFLEAASNWSDDDKVKVLVALDAGQDFLLGDSPNDLDIDFYEIDSLRDLAIQFVDEGIFGTIPHSIKGYLDYDAIARDLGMDYSEITIDGRSYVYRH